MVMPGWEKLPSRIEPWVADVKSKFVPGDWGEYEIEEDEVVYVHEVGQRTAKYVHRSTLEYKVLKLTRPDLPSYYSWGPFNSLERAKRVLEKLQEIDRNQVSMLQELDRQRNALDVSDFR